MKKLLVMLMSVFLFAAISSPAIAAPIVFRFAGQQPPEHLCTKMMNDVAKEIKAKTNGRVEVKVYPASQLGNYSLVMEEMLRGTIDGISNLFCQRNLTPASSSYTSTAMSAGYDSAKKVFAPGAWLPNKLNELGKPLGVHVLGAYIEGMIGIGSTKEVKQPLNPKVDKGVHALYDVHSLAASSGLPQIIFLVRYFSHHRQASATQLTEWPHLRHTQCSATSSNTGTQQTTQWSTSLHDQRKIMEEALTGRPEGLHGSSKKFTINSINTAQKEDNKYMDLMKKKGIKVYKYSEAELKPIKAACVTTWDELGKRGMTPELMAEFKSISK